MRATLILAALALAAGGAAAEPLAIVGAEVHLRPGQALAGATVIVDGGRVRAVGVGVAVPAGATVKPPISRP